MAAISCFPALPCLALFEWCGRPLRLQTYPPRSF
jgi:hypothetical protein